MDLRWYQKESVDSTWSYLCRQSFGNPVVVIPTGGGKSIIIAALTQKCVSAGGRVMILAHRKELLQQNADKLRRMLGGVGVGMYSAGLNERSTSEPVICAGIQSCWNKANEFGERHLVIVDEAHLVNVADSGMYRKFMQAIVDINPKCRLVGLTATPYRTDDGELCGGDSIFHAISYEATIPKLIEGGYLSKIVSSVAQASVDTSKLHVRGGEFIQREMEDLFAVPETVIAACKEIVVSSGGRRSVLVFSSGIGHGEMVRDTLESMTGEDVGLVVGSTPSLERAMYLDRFKNGSLRWLVNVDVLTTGFDAPNIDCIAVLRATCSPGLFAQICGRGFRLSEGKEDCLILDFGENIERHGPLDAKDYGKKRKSKGSGEAPEKFCESCKVKIPAGCRLCPECGTEQPMSDEEKHGASSSDAEILESLKPAEWYDVEGVNFREWHNRKKNTTTLRVDYQARPRSGGEFATMEVISEWVCLEHDGYAYEKALKWIGKRTRAKIKSIQSAIDAWGSGWFAETISVKAKRDGKFWKVTDHVLGEIPDPINEIVMDDEDPERATWGEVENELSDEVPF